MITLYVSTRTVTAVVQDLGDTISRPNVFPSISPLDLYTNNTQHTDIQLLQVSGPLLHLGELKVLWLGRGSGCIIGNFELQVKSAP